MTEYMEREPPRLRDLIEVRVNARSPMPEVWCMARVIKVDPADGAVWQVFGVKLLGSDGYVFNSVLTYIVNSNDWRPATLVDRLVYDTDPRTFEGPWRASRSVT